MTFGEAELGVTLKAMPLQVWEVKLAITGPGLTVIVITIGSPTQELDVGITVYVTVPASAVFTSVNA
jgi:hypothetical protein